MRGFTYYWFLLNFLLYTNENIEFVLSKEDKQSPLKEKKIGEKSGENSLGNVTTEELANVFRKKIVNLKGRNEVELVILVDGSYSIGPENFLSEMKFIQKVISDVEIGFEAFRLGVVIYSTRAVIHVDHLSATDSSDLEKCSLLHFDIPAMSYPGSNTNTKEALEKAEKILTRSRPNASKVVFLLTDGFSNMGNPLSASDILKEQGVEIFTFGIQNGNVKELEAMASWPVDEHAYLFGSFEEFEGFARRALHQDLVPGPYVSAKNSSSCHLLCADSKENGCCSSEATCSCGTISGHFTCLCPPGYYGTGLFGEGCTLCPPGTYNEGLFPGDESTCIPCPDIHHVITKYPATSKNHCVCGNGTVSEGMRCKIVSCPQLLPPKNGYFVKKKCFNVVNAACGVRCHMGYVLSGSSVRICQKNGIWSGTEPVCEAKSCEAPKPVSSSTVSCVSDEENAPRNIAHDHDKVSQEIFNEDFNLTAENEPTSTSKYPVGTVCTFSCSSGHSLIGSKTRSCLPMLKWSGLRATCKSIKCPPLPELSNGSVKPQNCTQLGTKQGFGAVCRFHCDPGYQLKGPKVTNCTGRHGTWSGKNTPSRCVDVEPPIIECPENFSVNTDQDSHFATVKLKLPKTRDNSGKEPVVWSKPPFGDDFPLRLIIGDNEIQVYSVDDAGNYAFCSFTVKVKDVEKPKILECRSPPVFFVSEFTPNSSDIAWREPVFDDNSGIPVSVVKTPHDGRFSKGTTLVTYLATDSAGNSASCSIEITILENPCEERPDDTNTLWECTASSENKALIACTVSCPDGLSLIDEPYRESNVFKCAYSGRKAYWTPDIFGGDVDLFPECSEAIAPEKIQNEIIVDGIPDLCEDLNDLSNVLKAEISHDEGDITVYCEDDGDEGFDEDEENDNFHEREKIGEASEKPNFEKTTEIIRGDGNLSDVSTEMSETRRGTTAIKRKEEINFYEILFTTRNTHVTTVEPNTIFFTNESKEKIEEQENAEFKQSSSPHDQSTEKQIFSSVGPRRKRLAEREKKRVRIRISQKGFKNEKETIGEHVLSDAIRKLYAEKRDEQSFSASFSGWNTKIVCREGSLPKNGICVKCAKGTFHDVRAEACLPCPLGHYQELEGQVRCLSCPEGHSTRKIRRKTFKQCKRICPAGSFGRKWPGSTVALAPCTLCSIGTYQHLKGQTFCEACPKNSTTLRTGADSVERCVLSSTWDVCSRFDCRNGGTCHSLEGLPFCKCAPGFAGSFCERIFDPCGSAPCHNGGSCEVVEPLNYVCHCLPGFRGDSCEAEIDECERNPCNGRGTCTDLTNGFWCDCEPGFKGSTCNETLRYCDELEPCLNGGKCVDDDDGGSYRCVCRKGFSGRHCDVFYDCSSGDCDSESSAPPLAGRLCTAATCRPNQRCLNQANGKTKCICLDGFRGPDCSEGVDANVVLRFPKYGVTEYAIADFPDGNLSQITVCVWIEAKDTFNYGTIFSYATSEEDNAFTLTDYSGLVLYVMGRHVVTDLRVNDGFWHFICVTWETDEGRWQVFLDGSLFSNGTGLSESIEIPGSGKLVIGQEQDLLGGGFNDVESFAGRLTNFDVWNNVLEASQIQFFFEECDNNFKAFIPWSRLLQEIHGEILEEHSPFCRSCDSYLELYRGEISYEFIGRRKVANYRCDRGYIIKFDSDIDYAIESENKNYYRRKCMKFGGWQPKEPKCKRISCGFPGYFSRGYISGRSYKFGDEIVYHCSEGYFLEGNDTRICTSDGLWSGTAPYCRGNSSECKKLIAPRHGSMFVYYLRERAYSSSLLTAGDRVEFICDKGYAIVGFGTLTCMDGGFWDRHPPTCEKIKCSFPVELSLFFSETEIANKTFYLDDLLTITCPSGRKLVLKCEEHGAWNSSDVNLCKNVCRSRPNSIKNGHVVKEKLEELVEEGERLRVVCMPGFQLQGDDFIECAENGTWIQARPTLCRRKGCGPPPPPPTPYQIVHEEGHDVGHRIFLRCSPGYKAVGDVIIRCQPNGRYSRVQNVCTKIFCETPLLLDGYVSKGSKRRIHPYGSKLVIECPPGKSVIPRSLNYLECGADGTWSALPLCV